VDVEDFLWPDPDEGVIVDGQLAFFDQQAPDHVPVPTEGALEKFVEPGGDEWRELGERLGTDPTAVVGKTNAELLESFGVAAYGRVMPGSAGYSHLITGGRLANTAASAGRTVWLDAAVGDVGDIFHVGEDPSASNGRYVSVRGAQSRGDPPTNSGISTYAFEVDAGAYEVFGRVWSVDGDSFWLRVDGGEWIEWKGLRSYRGWRWHAVPEPGEKHGDPRQFDLDAGTHTLEVGYRENRVRLDALLVTADGVPPIGRGLVPSPDEG
jgi:hypothetical protein